MAEFLENYERIEPETESHRAEKAVRNLVPNAQLPFKYGHVGIVVPAEIAQEPAGQHLLVLLIHLLARMKGLVRRISVRDMGNPTVLPGVPLVGGCLGTALAELVGSLSGARSDYCCDIAFETPTRGADVTVSLGSMQGVELQVGAGAWRALTGNFADRSDWSARSPIGPYLAACFAAAEVFKLLMRINFGFEEYRAIGTTGLSLFDYSQGIEASAGSDVDSLYLSDVAVAGAGAGGTAALYTLASFPGVNGHISVVDPGRFKKSNLGRYLMSTYEQVHRMDGKVESVKRFFERHSPGVLLDGLACNWHEADRCWQRVLCAVDTPEARWDVQRSSPTEIVEAGTLNGTLYAVLRMVPGGWCLECKHPRDPELTWKRRAQRWGLTSEEVRKRYRDKTPVTQEDLDRLSITQGRPVADFRELLGAPFDQVPSMTECGETPLSLRVPSQAAVLPLATTAAGIVLAAEAVKSMTGVGTPLSNYFFHDLRSRLRPDVPKFKPRREQCPACA